MSQQQQQLLRPPPATFESSRRIASLGPIASCLREALDEIHRANHDNQEVSPPSSKIGGVDDASPPSGKRKHSDHGDSDREGARESDSESELSLDGPMSEAIFDAYCKAVASTEFDRGKEDRSGKRKGDADGVREAPAAMLTGEVDCVNRIGGQWRMVVNNAVLKRRTFTRIGNGMPDTQYRSRLSLDWDDNKDAQCGETDEGEVDESEANGSVIYRLPGKIQILAYDDST